MFTRILVPLDGSRLAESTLPHAVGLAQVFGASVTLLHVLTKEVDGRQTPIDPLDWRLRRAEAETYLEGWTARLQELELPVHSEVVEGKAADTIVDVAREWGIDLIVIGSHGRSGLSKWTISSMAQKVVMRAHTSLLLVRTYRMSEPLSAEHLAPYQYRKILMPLDGSKRAEYVIGAVRPFLRQAELVGVQAENHAYNGTGEQTEVGAMADYGVVDEQSGCLCIVPHVVCRPELPRQTQPTHEEVEAVERLVEYNQRAAMHYLEQLSEQIGCPIESRLLAGTNAATALHRLAEEEAVDLVVLCAHGYGGDPQWPYGSVTTNFISYSDIPLLIVQDLRDANTGATIAEESTHQKKGH